MSPSHIDASADTTKVQALVARYLDPRATWTLADDDRARELRESPAARRAWALAIATHRAMVGAAAGLPSGHEQRRQAAIAMVRAGVAATSPASAASWIRASWLRIAAPLVAIGAVLAVLLFASLQRADDPDAWIRARGLGRMELPEPRVGLGVGGVTEDGREYDAVSSNAVHLEDWLRFSYTNERADLAWLYVFALQPTASGMVLRPIAPLPDEGQSLPIRTGHFLPLAFETRLAARHSEGPLRLVALFTAAPIGVDTVDKALTLLDPAAPSELPSTFEARLRERLPLGPSDVVQILDSAIVPGSAAPPNGPRQEFP